MPSEDYWDPSNTHENKIVFTKDKDLKDISALHLKRQCGFLGSCRFMRSLSTAFHPVTAHYAVATKSFLKCILTRAKSTKLSIQKYFKNMCLESTTECCAKSYDGNPGKSQ